MPSGNGKIKLSQHFSHNEFECRCGCMEGLVSTELVEVLQTVRYGVRAPLTITSGIRCKKHNTAVGGAKSSWHVPRNGVSYAADITYLRDEDRTDYNVLRLWVLADMAGAKGIGLYANPGRVHIDVRPTGRVRWIDKSWREKT